MQLFNSDNSDVIITNLNKNASYYIPYIDSSEMSFDIRSKQKTKFLKPALNRVQGIDISINVTAVFTDKTIFEWLYDQLSVKVIFKGDLSDESFVIDNVSISSPNISRQTEDFVRCSFTLKGYTSPLTGGILKSSNGTLWKLSVVNQALVTNSFLSYSNTVDTVIVPSTTKKWQVSIDDTGVLSTTEITDGITHTAFTIINADGSKWNLTCDDTGHIIVTALV